MEIETVVHMERGAIDHDTTVIKAIEGIDDVTQDMMIRILADEQGLLREFEGFLKEYEAASVAGRGAHVFALSSPCAPPRAGDAGDRERRGSI